MIDIKREKVSRFIKESPVTFIFLLIIIIYFIVITLNGGTKDIETLVRFGAFFPPFIFKYNQYYRFITSIFIHIGISHLFFNGYALYVFGTQIERFLGKKKYILFFLLTGLMGNIATYIFNPISVSAGASGSLFGIFGAFLYLIQRHKEMITPEGRKSIISMIGVNLVLTIVVPSISITAHLGGLIAGYILSYVFIK